MLILLTLLACADHTDPKDTGLDTGLDTATDTDSGADSGGETDTPTTDLTLNHVVVSLTVAGRGEGFDLDGDERVDNAAWALGAALDPLFEAALAGAPRVLVVQVADAEDLADDPSVQIALLGASDDDGDPSDNADGETFSAGAAVDADGRALVGADTALAGGAYQVELLDSALVLGETELSTATPLLIGGQVSLERDAGLIGFGVSVDALAAALVAAGYGEEAEGVGMLADLDTDGDGVDDALSIALAFDAAPCELKP